MDAQTYGRLVERGGYATGGVVLVGESGPQLTFLLRGNPLRSAVLVRDEDDGTAGVPAKV